MIPYRTRATAKRELYWKNAAGGADGWDRGGPLVDFAPYVKFKMRFGLGYFD
jgi:hypothetical protein